MIMHNCSFDTSITFLTDHSCNKSPEGVYYKNGRKSVEHSRIACYVLNTETKRRRRNELKLKGWARILYSSLFGNIIIRVFLCNATSMNR